MDKRSQVFTITRVLAELMSRRLGDAIVRNGARRFNDLAVTKSFANYLFTNRESFPPTFALKVAAVSRYSGMRKRFAVWK